MKILFGELNLMGLSAYFHVQDIRLMRAWNQLFAVTVEGVRCIQ